MAEPTSVREVVTEAVDRGADAAEEIHKAIAHIPLDMIGRMRNLADVADDAREVQDRAIGAVYDLVRGVNREVGRLTDEFLEVAAGEMRAEVKAAKEPPVEDAAVDAAAAG
jgi:hypothetical protein